MKKYIRFTVYNVMSLALMFVGGYYVGSDFSSGILMIVLAISMQMRVYFVLRKYFIEF